LHRYSKVIVGVALLAGLVALPFSLHIGFDADPASVQDPRAEAVQVFDEMRHTDPASLYTIDVLAPDQKAAEALAARLSQLPTVARALTLDSFIPDDQDAKLAAIQELAMIVPPFTLAMPRSAPTDPGTARAALGDLRARLGAVPADGPLGAAAARLRVALDQFVARHGQDDAAVLRLQHRLIGDLPETVATVRQTLTAGPVTRDDLPAALRARYVNPRTGQARVEVFSKLDVTRPENLERFVTEVQSVAPHAAGTSVALVETGRAVVAAFRTSTILAAVGIFALLFLVLRNVGRVLLVLLPLSLAGVLTLATMAVLGISFNLGNVIVLPLMIGLGVAFGIYFVLRWAEGIALEEVLRTSMPDAVLLSGLATMVSFGSMALSSNPAMAMLGRTLSIALFYILVTVLIVLPAVLALVQRRARRRAAGSLHVSNNRK
jgi:predicted RND superfamily exporter protein